MKLEGKVAIVAGGGQGIGEGCVKCLAEEGADVAVVDINGDIAKRATDDVAAMGRRSLPIVADLTKDDEVDRSVGEAVDALGKVDILVNNVGGTSEETARLMMEYAASLDDVDSLPSYMRYSSEVWDKFYQLNLKSHVLMSHAVTPHFMKQRSGSIVNISSIAGRLPVPTQMPYGAMKAGDISITWSLARALAPYNVRVNCVCPGHVYTPLWARGATGMLEGVRNARDQGRELPTHLSRFGSEDIDLEGLTPYDFWLKYIVVPGTPLGREQTAEDMGRAVAFLVSEDAKNITGQVLHVDGGVTMR
jgi:meso-butanediol dehydrogenase/(S,S)-butanediol dehydrogenase/diacetyl reductase